MRKEDSLYWVFSSDSTASLFQNLESHLQSNTSNLPLKMCIFISNKNIIESFPKSDIKRVETKIDILNKEENILKFNFTLFGNLGEKEKSSGIYFKYPEFENVFIYLSFDHMYIFKRVINNYFNKFYPEVSRIFLTSHQIKKIIARLQKTESSEILVSRFVESKQYPEISTQVRYEHEKMGYAQAFFEAEKDNYWVSSLNVFSRDFETYISRDGYFELINGSFNSFREKILNHVLGMAEARKIFYSNRERTKANDYRSEPVTIEFGQNLFNSPTDIESLTKKVFNTIPDSSFSASHSNPYLEMSYTDLGDGSSFNVWVVDKDKIHIVPQFRATHASLAKIINAIFEKFCEGKVVDFNTGKSEEND